jgi:hypothetical protein
MPTVAELPVLADAGADEAADEVAAGVVAVDELLLVTADEHAESAARASAAAATVATRSRGRGLPVRRPASEDVHEERRTTA